MAINVDRLWDESEHGPGVSDAEIARWEDRHGVKLPEALAGALRKQNGGLVRYSSVYVHPLDEITAAKKDLLSAGVGSDAPDLGLVFTFAYEDEEPVYFLNFNANGPSGEPSVHKVYHDPADFEPAAKTVDEFLSSLIAVSTTPAVDWSETARLDVVLHHETVNVGPVPQEMVLGRAGGVLVLYTHALDIDGETYIKTTIPEPLNPWFAFIFKFPPFFGSPPFLHLSPRDATGVVSIETTRTRDGHWKASTEHGFPLSVDVFSNSSSRLRALRRTLLGKAAVAKTGLVLAGSLAIIATLGVLAYLYR